MSEKLDIRFHKEPDFIHDCENCQFLGSFDGYDLYAYKTEHPYGNTLIWLKRVFKNWMREQNQSIQHDLDHEEKELQCADH